MARIAGSAAYRIAFVAAGVFTLATAVLGTIVYVAAHGLFVRQLAGEISDESTTLAAEFRSGGQRELLQEIAEREEGNAANELLYAVFAPDGRQIAGGLDTPMPRLGWGEIGFRDPRRGLDLAKAMTVPLGDGTRLVVAADYSGLKRVDHLIVSLFAAAFVVEVIFGILGAFYLGGYLQSRLSGIRDAAEGIMAGDMRQRIAVGPDNDEFDSLARTLNSMLDRNASLMKNVRQVSSDIAHDLRTPLTRLRGELESGLAADGPSDKTGLIEDAVERVDEILRLFAAILRISELEGSAVRRAFAPFDVSALVNELCESYAPAAEEGGRHLAWAVEAGLVVEGDRELIAQILVNLVDNALIHSPQGTSVDVTLARENGLIFLRVADNGPGVPESERARILERFTRLEASRSKPGHGLGLNLVEAIAKAHGASLDVASAEPGLSVTVRFARQDRDATCPQ